MNKVLHTPAVLIAEDDKLQAEMIGLFFRGLDFACHIVPHGRAALDYLAVYAADIRAVVLDLNMPVMNGMDTMVEVSRLYPHLPVVFLTGNADPAQVVAAMKLGAFDYLTKPVAEERFSITIRNAYKLGCMAIDALAVKWRSSTALRLHDLVGHNGGLRDLIDTARKLAATDVPVMIGGETGTGKDVLARAIHGESTRAAGPFVAINCGAIPENLIESILFGHEKGAFTGATDKTPGKFREAEGGTIFLDEIGDMPLAAQVRLLRVLQQHEVQPVGATRAVPINVRVMSATNRDLAQLVRDGRFREDLLYRLNVVPLTLPPLRQRVEDILPLADHFIARFVAEDNVRLRVISPAAVDVLQAYAWPGNVRELENVIHRALVLASGHTIQPHDFALGGVLAAKIQDPVPAPSSAFDETAHPLMVPLLNHIGQVRSLDDMERDIIDRTCRHMHGNIQQAARVLGIARATLYRKLADPKADTKAD